MKNIFKFIFLGSLLTSFIGFFFKDREDRTEKYDYTPKSSDKNGVSYDTDFTEIFEGNLNQIIDNSKFEQNNFRGKKNNDYPTNG